VIADGETVTDVAARFGVARKDGSCVAGPVWGGRAGRGWRHRGPGLEPA